MSKSKRVRKSDTCVKDIDSLVAAVKEIKIDQKSVQSIAIKYKIPRSSLRRYIAKLCEQIEDISLIDDSEIASKLQGMTSRGPPTVFSWEEEKALIEYLLACSKVYYGLSISELQSLAFEFANKIKLKYPESWNTNKKAGEEWYYLFMKRHSNLTLRTPEQISANRVKAFCKSNVDSFFDLLENVFTEAEFEPRSIWNMDETGFTNVPNKPGKVLGEKGDKRISAITSQERGNTVTMAIAVNAAGNSIPPFFLFPTKNMRSHYLDNSTPGSVGYANKSGWMQQDIFVKFMQHFIKHSNANANSKTLLLLDNHTSHLSIEALDLASENNIVMLSFPPHCSHRMQPLDVAVFAPVKTYYKQQCKAWILSNAGRKFEMHHIPQIVDKSLDLGLTPSNIKSGFRATGIYPFNRNIFTDQDFVAAELSGENEVSVLNDIPQDEIRTIDIVSNDTQENEVQTIAVGAYEEVSTSEPGPSTSMSRSDSLLSVLSDIGPMQKKPPRKKSNRGPKPQTSCILTSAEKRNALKERQEKREAKGKKSKEKEKTKTKSTPKTRATKRKLSFDDETTEKQAKVTKKTTSTQQHSSSEDEDFCIICMKGMPLVLTAFNSIECNSCKRPVHLKCANMRYGFFTCSNCNSD